MNNPTSNTNGNTKDPSVFKFLVDQLVFDYVRTVGIREQAILKELREKTSEKYGYMLGLMVSFPEQAQLMQLLLKLMGAKRVLDIGTFTGYSALSFALASTSIQVTTLDVSEEWSNEGKKYWKQAGVSDRINLIVKPALESLQELKQDNELFDFIFIDADKDNQLAYIELAYDLLHPNGLVVIDNVLWGTSVIRDDIHAPGCDVIRQMNKLLHQDERWDLAMQTIGDGATFLRKR